MNLLVMCCSKCHILLFWELHSAQFDATTLWQWLLKNFGMDSKKFYWLYIYVICSTIKLFYIRHNTCFLFFILVFSELAINILIPNLLISSALNHRLENETDNPLPLQVEPKPLPRDLLCTFPTVGTILRVIIDKGNEKHVLHLLTAGKWVRFLNILCEVHEGLWHGVLTPFTKIRYMSDDNRLIVGCQRWLHIIQACICVFT